MTDKKILIIEDDENFIKIAGRTLNNRNIKPDFEKNYTKGIEKLNKENYDLCISDLFIPEKDGIIEGEEAYKLKSKILYLTYHTKVENPLYKDKWWKAKDEIEKSLKNKNKNAPLGFYIAVQCGEKNIPYILLSQGDRHHGELGGLRFAFQYPSISNKAFQINGKTIDGFKLFCTIFYNEGINIDKGKQQTWIKVLKKAKNNLETRIQNAKLLGMILGNIEKSCEGRLLERARIS